MMGHRLLMAASNLGLTYVETVLQDKPVAFWQLNETSGTVAADSSGNGYNGTYEGAPTLGAAPIAPGLGKSVSLAGGGSQYVTLSSVPSALQLVEGTFEAWTQQPTVVKGAGIFCSGFNGSTVNWAIGQGAKNNLPATSALLFGGNYNGGWDYAGYESTLTAGEPAHVVYTNDGTTALLYLNGAEIYSGASQSFTPNAEAIFMGGNWNGPSGNGWVTLQGVLSNCAIYNTVLSAARIQAHYNAGIS